MQSLRRYEVPLNKYVALMELEVNYKHKGLTYEFSYASGFAIQGHGSLSRTITLTLSIRKSIRPQ